MLRQFAGWLIALIVAAWRLTCRYRIEHDPRPTLRANGRPYLYALLHAHQIAAVFVNDEPCMAAMVSRSADGDLLVPSLRLRRVLAVRGSSRSATRDKGGRAALTRLGELTKQGIPGLLAVDGPKGPRNVVHRGIIDLAQEHGAVILPVIVVPSRRWILRGTWDRMQVPHPFSTIRLVFGPPISASAPAAALRATVTDALAELERTHDPDEVMRTAQAAENAA